jgi:hypothetical protein
MSPGRGDCTWTRNASGKLRENCPLVQRSLGLVPSRFERGVSKDYDRVCIVGYWCLNRYDEDGRDYLQDERCGRPSFQFLK